MKTLLRCVLKKGREKPLKAFHPWIFSGAIDFIDEGYKAGDLIRILAADESFLGIGSINPASQITIRMFTFADEPVDAALFRRKIKEAVKLRGKLTPEGTTGIRLIHSEGDFLPGLIVDRYGDYLAAQFLTAGIEPWRDTIIQILRESVPVKGIYERSDPEVRAKEELAPSEGLLWGEEPPELVAFTENGFQFQADLREGQKSGFFLDQRDNRSLIGKLSRDQRVLNCFGYTGAFSVYAGKGGAAQVTTVDTSQPALDIARLNLEQNGLLSDKQILVQDDVFKFLRSDQQSYDLIILDPPAFCKRKDQVEHAARGYKDINLIAFKKLTPGGLLFTSSCSSYVNADLFQKIIFGAAKDSGREVRILTKTAHAFDHPVSIYHPEGDYLKSLLCQAV